MTPEQMASGPIATTRRARLALCTATPLLLWLSFPPADLGFLAWVALVPLLLYVAGEDRRGRLAFTSYLSGLIYFLPSVQWIHYVSWPAWFGLGAYLACYVLLFAALVRLLAPRAGVRFCVVVPAAWCACERLKEWVITGFPWFELGHTQHAWTQLLQIADVTGVAGISFLVALANAVVAGLVIALREGRARADRKGWGALAAFAALLVGAVVYGRGRIEEVRARAVEGPEVGVVQGNIPQDVKELEEDISDEEWDRRVEGWWRTHVRLTDAMLAGRRSPPDVIVWAETMFPWPFYMRKGEGAYPPPWIPANHRIERVKRKVRDEWRTRFLTGAQTSERDVEKQAWREYNSVYLLSPSADWEGRYDKVRLVVLGEYVPMQDEWPWVERMVKSVSKLVAVPRLRRGGAMTVFRLGRDDWRFGAPICFEVMFADACREFARDGATFLVTLSNDGWFKGSEELDQILIVTKFRAVECRIGIVRATNTGISALVTPWGEADGVLTAGGERKEVEGTLVRRVLLREGESFYARHGDLLGPGCEVAVLGLAGLVLAARIGRRLIRGRPAVG